MGGDNNQIYVYLDKKNAVAGKSDEHDGYAIIGFDLAEFTPLNKLSLCVGKIKNLASKVDACYRAAAIKMEDIVGDTTYSGTVKKMAQTEFIILMLRLMNQ